MKISLNVIKQFIDFELPPINQLVERLNQRLGQVEEVTNLGEKYKDATIVRVVECRKHPNADKLSVVKIDDNGVTTAVERDQVGLIEVVCGAPNVHANMWAVWLPPKSIIPETFDDDEPFCLASKELRGVMSNGMLASERELGLGNNHQGIVELTDTDLQGSTLQIRALESLKGANFAEVFGLDDYVIDIENKMFTHRPDLFGQLGVAREIAGIFGEAFTSPEGYLQIPNLVGESGLRLEVVNDVAEASSRFIAMVVQNMTVGDSPMWLKCQLVAMGAKPISNIVDLTNYAMLISAQPIHAYDYDKLREHQLGVRFAKPGEEITLLNNKTYQLDAEDIVIVDGAGVIGLAGVMGGQTTEVTAETQNVVFEVANFNMYKIRKTSMRHGIFTDAVTRFTKGQSPMQIDRVVNNIAELLPNGQISEVIDTGNVVASRVVAKSVVVSIDFINQRLGSDFTKDQITKILHTTELIANDTERESLSITVPFWRTDLELPEDIVEEVGRLFGFDKLPRMLPIRSTKPVTKNRRLETKQRIRQSLLRAGANEVLSHSFVHEKVLHHACQDVTEAFRLSNALSPDLQYYRLSILPSLLDKVNQNIRAGHDQFVLYEIGKGHVHGEIDDEGLPIERDFVDLVYAGKKLGDGAAYFRAQRIVKQLSVDFGFSVNFSAFTDTKHDPAYAMFEPGRSAVIQSTTGHELGIVGEFKQSVIRDFKLPEYTAGVTFDLNQLEKVILEPRQTYTPLSNYPSTTQDVSLRIANTVSYRDVYEAVQESVLDNREIQTTIKPITIYQSSDDQSTKTVTLRIKFISQQRTLSDNDIVPIMQNIANLTSQKLNAVVV